MEITLQLLESAGKRSLMVAVSGCFSLPQIAIIAIFDYDD